MSRNYDLEEALREFIREEVGNAEASNHSEDHDEHNDYRYASEDHEHDDSDFESKVDYHLSNFTAQQYQGCGTKQAFQSAVMSCIEYWLANGAEGEGGESADAVRPMLKTILSVARAKAQTNTAEVVAVLARCLEQLAVVRPEVVTQMQDANGSTFTRV